MKVSLRLKKYRKWTDRPVGQSVEATVVGSKGRGC